MVFEWLSVPGFVTEIVVFCSLSAACKTVEKYEIRRNELVAEGLGKMIYNNAAVTPSLLYLILLRFLVKGEDKCEILLQLIIIIIIIIIRFVKRQNVKRLPWR